jgi:hypothetical protein
MGTLKGIGPRPIRRWAGTCPRTRGCPRGPLR